MRQAEIRRLAVAVRDGRRELAANRAQLQRIVNDLAPGPDRSPRHRARVRGPGRRRFSHPGRCRDDAAFAALAGVSPLEASSGQKKRHRLNRGGDRTLNQAIHTIAVTRMRDCPTTRAYIERRVAEGKREREIRRCLKRYIARQLHRALTVTMTPAIAT